MLSTRCAPVKRPISSLQCFSKLIANGASSTHQLFCTAASIAPDLRQNAPLESPVTPTSSPQQTTADLAPLFVHSEQTSPIHASSDAFVTLRIRTHHPKDFHRDASPKNSFRPKNTTTFPLRAKIGQTILQAAQTSGINIDGTCEGTLACSTCHCVIGNYGVWSQLPQITPEEKDLLDSAVGLQTTSRLSCQVVVSRAMDNLEIAFPAIYNDKTAFFKRSENKNELHRGWAHEPKPTEQHYHDPPSSSHGRTSNTKHGDTHVNAKRFVSYTKSAIPALFAKYVRPNSSFAAQLGSVMALADILPFRTNNYVVEELIDWSNVPDDPIFQLTFPQPGMLADDAGVAHVASIRANGGTAMDIRTAANLVRARLNPHPAKQREMNLPIFRERNIAPEAGDSTQLERGMQHKYRETVLFFPSESQYCHSYCSYCFRWAQFVGSADTQFASNDVQRLMHYLEQSPNVTDLLLTGGDPMVLNSRQLGRYLDAIANNPSLGHIQNIRIGSKSLAYWPYKYVTDDDAENILRLLERTVDSGKHVALMAHFTHPAELSTPVVQEAIRRIQATGVQIRCQAPLVDHVNNDAQIWANMWREQVRLGLIPYYMFVERDTGVKQWFGVPLERALEVYNGAIQQLSGLARTARGPCMSCTPGKVQVLGIEEVAGEKVFILKFLQARDPRWNSRVFFAKYDDKAQWMDELIPAFGAEKFFFEDDLVHMEVLSASGMGSSGQLFQ